VLWFIVEVAGVKRQSTAGGVLVTIGHGESAHIDVLRSREGKARPQGVASRQDLCKSKGTHGRSDLKWETSDLKEACGHKSEER
jgi:hypothetical protein